LNPFVVENKENMERKNINGEKKTNGARRKIKKTK